MTNFSDPKPYISEKKAMPTKPQINRSEAIRDAIKIIRENKRIVEKASKSTNENSYR